MLQERGPLDCLRPACLLALMLLADGTAAGVSQCPGRISCLLDRRHPCVPGTGGCGPCLAKYQEDPGGKCVLRSFRTHVSKDRPKVSDPEQLIDFLGSLLKSPKAARPAGLKSSRMGWLSNEEGLKSPPDIPNTSLEGYKTSVGTSKTTLSHLKSTPVGHKNSPERLKTLVGSMKTTLSHLKATSAGMKNTPEGLKTKMGGVKTTLSHLKTTSLGLKNTPEGHTTSMGGVKTTLSHVKTSRAWLKTSSVGGTKTTLDHLKASPAGLKASVGDLKTPREELKATSETATSFSKERIYQNGPHKPTDGPNVPGDNTTGGLPAQWRSGATTTLPNATVGSSITHSPGAPTPARHEGPVREPRKQAPDNLNDAVSLTLVVICAVTGISGLLVAALCWYRLQKEVRLAQKMAYTAYRGSRQYSVQRPGDAHLAQSVQVHHYQHQKKHIQNLEESALKAQQQPSTESEADNEGGEYTVYECPGLAPTGEMEIHNPLFFDSAMRSAPRHHGLSLK
ncbi:uncharacterized protein [Ambystoma mexicanum]|uniref:uncharacterized protein n=1 Tax=Ambystoma mexicanum TaxID=8296 RepID=UPI0037E84FEC